MPAAMKKYFVYKLDAGDKVVNGDAPRKKIVTGLLSRHEHEAKGHYT